MSINQISLTAGMRANLLGLQGTADLLNTTQNRLGTGKKVNSALDNPINYFAARAHMSRASDLTSLKDYMGEAIQTIKAADAGINSITDLINQAKGLANTALGAAKNQVKIEIGAVTAGTVLTVGGQAYTATAADVTASTTEFNISDDPATIASNVAAKINAKVEGTTDMVATATGTTLILEAKLSTVAVTQASDVVSAGANTTILTDVNSKDVFSERASLANSYNELISQIDAVVISSGYKGTNLLMDNDLNVTFEGTSLSVKGFSSTATDLDMATSASTTTSGTADFGWAVNKDIQGDVGKMDNAVATLRSEASKLAINLSIINSQLSFSNHMIATLTEGADKLTLADMNEEGANMLALQTQQALGITALSLSSQASQSVLRLFG